MKSILLYITAAITLAACSQSDEPATIVDVDAPSQQESISFMPYMARNTRATEIVDISMLQAADKGFGVFAYDQGTDDIITYNAGRIDPNFMFNEQVTWNPSSGGWEYTPVKYWPNTPGNMVSFFAYAPYIPDIMQIKGNPRLILEKGNVGPKIYYNTLVANLNQALDLCWAADASTGMLNHVVDPDHAPVDFVKTPAYNKQPNVAVTSQVKFNFRHALSRIKFNVQIFNDMMTDGGHHGTPADGGAIDANTTITIKNLKLVGLLAREGNLSLYDGKWDADYETRDITLLPYLDPTALVYRGTEAAAEVDLFDRVGQAKYLTLIPGARYKIEIEYWVETVDPTPGAHPFNSTVTKNVITSQDEFTLEQGKAYEFHLNLGMTTVKFDATVTDWALPAQNEIDLPNNH